MTELRRVVHMARATQAPRTAVWDPLVRIFHWCLVLSFAVALLTREQAYSAHLLAGYAVLGVVAARTAWGFVGPTRAQFSDFIYAPRVVLAYLKSLVCGAPRHFLGHNPAGGLMVILLLLCLAVVTLSGVALDAAENRAGPLGATRLFLHTDDIAAVHELSTDLSLILIAVHLCGVAVMSVVHGENLVAAMLNGHKTARDA